MTLLPHSQWFRRKIGCLLITLFGAAVLLSAAALAQNSDSARTYVEVEGLSATIGEKDSFIPWEEAKDQCERLDYKGGGGWRLPDANEVRKVNAYKYRALLPAQLKDLPERADPTLTKCTVRTWTSDSDGYPFSHSSLKTGVWYCKSQYEESSLNFNPKFRSLAMCVRTGKPQAPPSPAPAKPVVTPDVPSLNLTRMPDSSENRPSAADERRDHENARLAAEQQSAREAAEQLARKFAAEIKARENCLLPGNRNMCGCLKYQAKPAGGWKTCSK
jgi:hypothetical protein